MMKTLTILLAPLMGLVALGARAAEGTSLTGPEIAHHGNGDGAPACTSCHGEHFQGQPGLEAPALAGLPAPFILSRLAKAEIDRILSETIRAPVGPEFMAPPVRKMAA
jgi:cytochrome c553